MEFPVGTLDFTVPYSRRTDFDDPNQNLDRRAISVIGRLGDDVSLAAAQEEIELIWSGYDDQMGLVVPGANSRDTVLELRSIEYGTSTIREDFRTPLLILQVAALVLLLTVCVSLGGLFSARALASRHETAVRLSVGASPYAVARPWFLDGLLVAVAGGVTALALTGLLVPLIVGQVSSPSASQFTRFGRLMILDVPVDLRISLFLRHCQLSQPRSADGQLIRIKLLSPRPTR